MWDELQKVSSLRHVASPVLKFEAAENQSLPNIWKLGEQYQFNLSFYGLIPLGDHFIKLVKIDEDKKTIISHEHGRLTKVWNHTIRITPIDNQTIKYTDEIEIKAGFLTIAIWLFAHFFL